MQRKDTQTHGSGKNAHTQTTTKEQSTLLWIEMFPCWEKYRSSWFWNMVAVFLLVQLDQDGFSRLVAAQTPFRSELFKLEVKTPHGHQRCLLGDLY